MARFYWPVAPAQDRLIRERMAQRLLERHKRNWDARMDELPVVEFPSGREELAFYRSREFGWWANLASEFPDRAIWRFLRYARLLARYGFEPV